MTPRTYRRRPATVEAVQWTGGPEQALSLVFWAADCVDDPNGFGPLRYAKGIAGPSDPVTGEDWAELTVETLNGEVTVTPRDWIIRGIKGEFYPCAPDIFEATYEPVEDGPSLAEIAAFYRVCAHSGEKPDANLDKKYVDVIRRARAGDTEGVQA